MVRKAEGIRRSFRRLEKATAALRGSAGSALAAAALCLAAAAAVSGQPAAAGPGKPATVEQLEEYLRQLFLNKPQTPEQAAVAIAEIAGATEDLAARKPDSPVVGFSRLRLGELAMALGQYEVARQHYTEYLRVFPQSQQAYEAHLHLGECMGRMGRWSEAIEHLEKGVRLAALPHARAGGRFLLALAHARVGNSAAAKEAVEALRRENPALAAQAETGLWRLENLAPGKPAPDISGTDLLTGHAFRLSGLRGRPVLLAFGPVLPAQVQPRLREWIAAGLNHKHAGLAVVAVCFDADPVAVLRYVRERRLDWAVLCDGRGPESPSARAYRAPPGPMWLVIDHAGMIVAVDPDGDALEQALQQAAGPKPPAGPPAAPAEERASPQGGRKPGPEPGGT